MTDRNDDDPAFSALMSTNFCRDLTPIWTAPPCSIEGSLTATSPGRMSLLPGFELHVQRVDYPDQAGSKQYANNVLADKFATFLFALNSLSVSRMYACGWLGLEDNSRFIFTIPEDRYNPCLTRSARIVGSWPRDSDAR